ncbi:MAG: hypothetical protein NDI58_04900, partial [Geothrix sp.]|nr:hypothetical protein [Geothrix sp.]
MGIGKMTDNLRMRGKFNLLLAIQVLALLAVGGMGFYSVDELQNGQGIVAAQLAKTAQMSKVLNGMN